MERHCSAALVAALLLGGGCYGKPDTLGLPCRVDDDCNDEQVCNGASACMKAPPESDPPDTTDTDACPPAGPNTGTDSGTDSDTDGVDCSATDGASTSSTTGSGTDSAGATT